MNGKRMTLVLAFLELSAPILFALLVPLTVFLDITVLDNASIPTRRRTRNSTCT